MKINLDFKNLVKYYRSASSLYNKILIIMFIVVAGLLIIYAVNPPYKGEIKVDENKIETQTLIGCPQSPDTSLNKDAQTPINTVTQISLINYETEVLVGQNKKNLIPKISNPDFLSYQALGSCFSDDRLVIAVTINNVTRLYPQAILEYHIVINDIINDTPVIIVYTPISGFYRVFKSTVKNDILIFAHSGSLYKNTDLLVDYKSDSLWSAKDGRALVGVMSGAVLEPVDFRIMNYGKAKKEFPIAQIMSFITGYQRPYGIDPFITFKANNVINQQPTYQSASVDQKSIVLGFTVNKLHYAIPINKISKTEPYRTKINEQDLKVIYDDGEYYAYLGKTPATELKPDRVLWYVWYDYYPDTRVI